MGYANNKITSVQWSPFDANILATASKDSKCAIWKIAQKGSDELKPEFIHGGHTSMIYDISWNSNEPYLLSSVDSSNELHIWKIARDLAYTL